MLNNLLLGQTAEEKLYVENVFSTWLYTGTGSAQTITNGVDLSGKGGIVWLKSRTTADAHYLVDTSRGSNKVLYTNSTIAEETLTRFSSFNNNGFSLSATPSNPNVSGDNYASWTFRKAPKFFDIVTYTGDGAGSRPLAHSLGVAPGMIIIKATSTTSNWSVYHRGNGTTEYANISLNQTNAAGFSGSLGVHNATTFNANFVKDASGVAPNVSGVSYVAYLFAHDTTADGIVQCGSFTGNGSSTGPEVNLGWEPQFVLIKQTTASSATNWVMLDNMRGIPTGGNSARLNPNTTSAESSTTNDINLIPTGFQLATTNGSVNASSGTYIYLAIRRGPMRTPTDATKVFSPQIWTGNSTTGRNIATGFPVDLTVEQIRTASIVQANLFFDRLRGYSSVSSGNSYYLRSQETSAEVSLADYNYVATMDGFNFGSVASGAIQFNNSGVTAVGWNFRRAPGFFDVVCYTGTGSARTVSHNLGVAPELMIVKMRDASTAWAVYSSGLTSALYGIYLNSDAAQLSSNGFWNSTAPSSSVFSLGAGSATNANGSKYVSYLFASCPGVSKVFSFTGNGSSQNIDCGFTNGARFVLIKRTDSTGNWMVADTARGLVSGNDPSLALNSTAAEVTSLDWLDPYSAGFTVNQESTNNANVNGATYIGIAIA